jgi:hypothetical protein
MSFLYSASIDALAVTLATDLFEVTVAADRPVRPYRMRLGQTTDLGDANEEVLRIGLYRAVTAGSGGTALTENRYQEGDAPAPTATIIANHSTASTGGTLLEIIPWNIRIPLDVVWLPEERPRVDATEDPFSFRLLSAPTDSVTISGTLIYEEG